MPSHQHGDTPRVTAPGRVEDEQVAVALGADQAAEVVA